MASSIARFVAMVTILPWSSAFLTPNPKIKVGQTHLKMTQETTLVEPQVLATGYSQDMDMFEAIREASEMALSSLPRATETSKIDLAIISVSSLYDGNVSPSTIVPAFLEATKGYGQGIQHLVGSTSGGFVSSATNWGAISVVRNSELYSAGGEGKDQRVPRVCKPAELEGAPGVSVTYCILPDVQVKTFHVLEADLPDDIERLPPDMWKQAVGLKGHEEAESGNSAFFLLPSPAFQNDLDDLLRGLNKYFQKSKIFGAIASTVSSLSRARLFRYEVNEDCIQTLADGCVGVGLTGDIEVKMMIAQGAKPVGGVYQIVKGQESTIFSVALDEAATELVIAAEEEEKPDEREGEELEDMSASAKMAQAYAKARIPKPVLAEANFLMKTLSDDDQAFMRKSILVGVERGGSIGRNPSELARLAEGQGHRFTVHQVASASMKDGSVTFSLGSVNVEQGTRLRFFVRESAFAKKEIEALWMGYKRRTLTASVQGTPPFTPTGCLLFPTLDRGSKFFMGKPGYESGTASEFLPTVPCISGFFCNGVIGALGSDIESGATETARVHGSASGYVLLGSLTGRPIFSPAQAAADESSAEEQKVLEEEAERQLEAEDTKRRQRAKSFETLEKKAPRDENGELILKRREVHSGRALTVSTVEWSVAEKTATPSSTLEGFMWDKETEVDRFRERVPLSNLVSQCRLSMVDPTSPKPRNWIGRVKDASTGDKFVIIPECKRVEPGSGSLYKRYDLNKLVKEFALAGVPAISVNCDGVLFGGSLDDITKARDAASKAALEIQTDDDGVVAPPIMASDLLLYPYQLYKIRLAGADAVNLIVGALAAKDLVYLTKIASSLQLQTLLTVTSAVQIQSMSILSAGGVGGLIVSNRQLEDFSFDMTGQQALDILKSEALNEFKEKHGDVPVLVEGRVGIIERENENGEISTLHYLKELKAAGATGAIVGGGLVSDEAGSVSPLENLCAAN